MVTVKWATGYPAVGEGYTRHTIYINEKVFSVWPAPHGDEQAEKRAYVMAENAFNTACFVLDAAGVEYTRVKYSFSV